MSGLPSLCYVVAPGPVPLMLSLGPTPIYVRRSFYILTAASQ